jgi:hypothetical protein
MRAAGSFVRRLCVLIFVLLAARTGAAQSAPPAVTGIVQDETGAILPGASVDLVGANGASVQSTTTSDSGAFRFERVAPGQYEVRATFEGFKPASNRLRVGNRSPGPQRLVLELAGLTQEITVSGATAQVDTTASNNLDAVAVDQKMLESLPVFDQDYITTMSRFLDSGSLGNVGVSLVVNGMEVNALRVSASAVEQIRINQDPYAAEYARPGRGRIEILTKPGGQEYHGEANVIGRDARFDARNAFITTRPAEQKRILEGVFGGPLGQGGKTSFMLSAHDQKDDQQALVYAIGLSGTIQDAVPQPVRQSLAAASITRQLSDKTTISIRPNYEYESTQNRAVGGTTLAEAGTNFTHNEQQVTYTQQSVVSPALFNQFQVLVGHEREPTMSVSAARGIVVAGALTEGGAQGDLLRTETHMQLNESLGWTRGRHLVRAGFQLPDWSRRGFFDHTNFGGTFYFSGLDTFSTGQPYAFIQQHGNGDVVFLEKQVGAYVKDDWQIGPGFSTSLGLRYDWQNYFHDTKRIAPRASLAYAPGNSRKDVIRAGAGIFNDRSGPVAVADLLHYQPWRADAVRDLEPIVSRSVRFIFSWAVSAAEHRAACPERADSPHAAVQRGPRPPAPEDHDPVSGLHRVSRLPSLPIARHQCSSAPAVRVAFGSGLRCHPGDRVRREAADRLAAAHRPREAVPLVHRPDTVHLEPRLQRHQWHLVVSVE